MLTWLGKITAISAVTLAALPVSAQTCAPLRIAEGTGTQVEKSVSIPATGVTKSNWNTDFVVPSTQRFSRYVAEIVPQNGGEYEIQMFLKYNNETADKVYDQTIKLQQGKPFTIPGTPRTNAIPYQVNLKVGGVQAVGNSYTASVSGCG